MDRDALRARVEEILAEQARFAPSAVGFGSGMGGMLPRRRAGSKSAKRAPVTRKHSKAARGMSAKRRATKGGRMSFWQRAVNPIGAKIESNLRQKQGLERLVAQQRARAGGALRIGGRMRVMKKLPRKHKVGGAGAAHAAMVKKVMAQNPGMSLGQASKLAKAMREGRA